MVPDELVRRMRDGTAVPLLGAGVSRPSGIVGWNELVQRLRKRVEDAIRAPIMEGDLDLLETPRVYSRLQGSRQPLYELLEEAVGPKFRPNRLHTLVGELPAKTIITTNWDSLIEEALRDRGPLNVIFDDSRVSTWRESAAVQIVKLHGSITTPASIVFSEEDYHRLYGGDSLLLHLVRNIIATRSIVAIGFSMRDTYVKLLFTQVARLAANTGNPHYVVLPESASDVQGEYLRSAGFIVLRAVATESDPYGVAGFLEELRDRTFTQADNRHTRGRLLLRETNYLRDHLGADRTLRIRASLGPLSTPDYDADDSLQRAMFGDLQLYRLERSLRDLCVELVQQHGARVRFIGFPFDRTFAIGKGYSDRVWADRLRALQDTARVLGDAFAFAPALRASDTNTWTIGDLAHIESRKTDASDPRSYGHARLETDGLKLHRAREGFDAEFDDLLIRAGGRNAALAQLLEAAP